MMGEEYSSLIVHRMTAIEADEVTCEHEMFPATLCVRESVVPLAAR